jgi:hypothetical protein
VEELAPPYTPERYISIIKEAEKHFDVLIIDSISHEWFGPGGCLEIHEAVTKGSNSQNSYTAWAKVTPRHNAFIAAIVNSPLHIISTVRTKTGYEMGEKDGKKTVQKIGLQAVTRDGFDYENTVVFSLNEKNFAECKKDRTSIFNGLDFQITEDTGKTLLAWLESGTESPNKTALPAPAKLSQRISEPPPPEAPRMFDGMTDEQIIDSLKLMSENAPSEKPWHLVKTAIKVEKRDSKAV